MLTAQQRAETKAICDEVCEHLETSREYVFSTDERDKIDGVDEAVWVAALVLLRAVGFSAERVGSVVTVRTQPARSR